MKNSDIKALVSNWNHKDDKGVFLDQETLLERVPAWAGSWERINAADLQDLKDAYTESEGKPAPESFDDMLAATTEYSFVVVSDDDTVTPLDDYYKDVE